MPVLKQKRDGTLKGAVFRKQSKERGIMMSNTFFHGTTDALDIGKILLPAIETGNKREDWREKYTDQVFFTNSLVSAYKYADKACKKYGGKPIVYKVVPVGQYCRTVNNEFVAEKARIVGIH